MGRALGVGCDGRIGLRVRVMPSEGLVGMMLEVLRAKAWRKKKTAYWQRRCGFVIVPVWPSVLVEAFQPQFGASSLKVSGQPLQVQAS